VRTLVLGIGNLLLCDEGIGIHVVRALQQEQLPTDVVILEAGTAFLDALPEIELADRIIVVDAMKAGEAPGTVYRISFKDCAKPECIASLHGFDLSRVLFLAGREIYPEVIVIGVEPARIEWGMEISPLVRPAIPLAVDAVREEFPQRWKAASMGLLN
jgi:hydrogenase maturation protease